MVIPLTPILSKSYYRTILDSSFLIIHDSKCGSRETEVSGTKIRYPSKDKTK